MFTFPVQPDQLFAERAQQFAGWGIPPSVVARVRARAVDMWDDGATGWVGAWAAEARTAEANGRWLRAALCWGGARFPCVATPPQQRAYERQLDCYRRAAERIPATFLRWVLDVPYRRATTPVAVHVWRRPGVFSRSLLVISGGVDTWKVELHRAALLAALATGMTVAAMDMPGTGESAVALAPDADEIVDGVIAQVAERVGARRSAYLGISFGGHWAVKLAATGRADAAVDLGGPIGAGGAALDVDALPNGMTGIIGNALHLDAMPGREDTLQFAADFSLRTQGVLDQPLAAPLLAINGTRDQYIPVEDTSVFAADPNATVWLVRDATHCAAEHIRRVLGAAFAWTHARLEPTRRTATAEWLTGRIVQPLLNG